MYCGFGVYWPAGGSPEIRLALIERSRQHRPSLVSVAHSPDGSAAILLGRIFYRDDLLARLPDLPGLHRASDASLALAVYQTLGRRGMELIEGELSLVIWDSRKRRVWAQRDPFGTWPLFWSVSAGGIGVSTRVEALAEEGTGRSFNLDTMAEFLMQPMPADELPCEETFFQGIQRVRPGTIVELGEGQVVRHTYWDWAARIGRTEAASLQEAGEQFGDLLRQAVVQRIPPKGSLATHLSGGMDSSSVTCLARNELAGRAGGSPLFTLSLVYQRPSLVGERSYIDRVLVQGGPVQPCFLEADDVLYYDWFQEDLPRHGEPSGLLRSMPSHRLLVRAADQMGAVMTLGGDGSDEIASYQPYHLADLLRRGRWLPAVKEAARWSRSRNRGLGSVLRQFGLEPLCPLWWREGWGPWLRRGYGRWPRLSFFSIPPWVRPEFARRHDMRQRGRAYARRIFGAPTEASWNLSMLATTSGDWQRWYLAAPLGLNLSQPFRDPRLVCFTLGLPGDLRGVPGVTKPLLQTAMRGVLPDEILAKKCSPGFDDVVGTGLRRNMPHLEQLVRHPLFGELGIIDPEQFIPLLHQAAVGIGDSQATDRLDKTLALIAWFDQVVHHRPAGPAWVSLRMDETPGSLPRRGHAVIAQSL
jgi:asparagine synthase (glutamine-hydrolysing)